MKLTVITFVMALVLFACQSGKKDKVESGIIEVATFKGQQVTGVTVSVAGRVFANFPRWRTGVKNSVVEINAKGEMGAYPNEAWNTWEIGDKMEDSVFVAIQSVVAHKNSLFVLDTRNPLFQGVKSSPRIFEFDLTSDQLKKIHVLSEQSYRPNSYINDLRVDDKNHCIFMTDSGEPGLVVLKLNENRNYRVLDNHFSTKAEQDHLTFGGIRWNNTVHSDGIALDTKNMRLYYHSLTGYNLYSVSVDRLVEGDEEKIRTDVKMEMKTAAPDGMIFDEKGNLYYADLENNKIQYLTPDKEIKTLHQGKDVKWADTFSIYKGYLYFSNSRINETGNGVDDLVFGIYKIKI